MSWPLWPQDMETLCPSAPFHTRHALAIYCTILLNTSSLVHRVLRRHSTQPLSTSRSSLSRSVCCVFFLCVALLFQYHSFFSSFFILLTIQQLQTWRYTPPYHHDAWPPASRPLRGVTIAAEALRLISCFLIVKDNAIQSVPAYITFMGPLWEH